MRQVTWVVLFGFCGLVLPAQTRAICRVVRPISGAAVAFDPTTVAVLALAHGQTLDFVCDSGAALDAGSLPPRDAGPSTPEPDAAVALDAALEPDATIALDAGVTANDDAAPQSDASDLDAAVGLDAEAPDASPMRPAWAYDDAGAARCVDGTIARRVTGSVVSMVVQPSMRARGGTGGLIMPVPARADVRVGEAGLIQSIANLQVPSYVEETVEYVEDRSLGFQCTDPHYVTDLAPLAGPATLLMGCSSDGYYRPGTENRATTTTRYDGGVVRSEVIPTTADYDVTVLRADSFDALREWLDAHHFVHEAVDDAAFRHYVKDGAWFVAVNVHPSRTDGAQVQLAPLVVAYPGAEIPLTHKLQYDPRGGTLMTDAIVLADARMDAADGSAITEYAALTRFTGAAAGFGLSAGWLTRLTLARVQQQDLEDSHLEPVANVAVAGGLERRRTEVHIPFPCCPGGSIAPGSMPARRFTRVFRYSQGQSSPASTTFPMSPPVDAQYCQAPAGSRGGGSMFCAAAPVVTGWGPVGIAVALVLLRRRRRLGA